MVAAVVGAVLAAMLAAGSGGERGAGGGATVALGVDACPVQAVMVYRDRAEVTRAVEIPPQPATTTAAAPRVSVVVSGLSESADTDSVRVRGAAGSAPCTILAVSLDTNYTPLHGAADAGRVAMADAAVAAAERKHAAVEAELARVAARGELVKGFLRTQLTTPPAQAAAGGRLTVDDVARMLDFHDNEAATADDATLSLKDRLARARSKLEAARSERRKINKLMFTRKASRDVSIELAVAPRVTSPDAGDGEQHCDRDAPVKLLVTYIVRGASWAPTYDLRARLRDAGPGSSASLSLTYTGVVRQATGEDWVGVDLTLSTTSPSVGGSPPMPPTRTVCRRYGGSPPLCRTREARRGRSTLVVGGGPLSATWLFRCRH